MDRCRILVLIPTLQYGGAETDVARLVTRLNPDEFHVTVYPFLAPGPLLDTITAAGVTVVEPTTPAPQRRPSPSDKTPPIDRLLARAIAEQDRPAIFTLVAIAEAVDQNKPLTPKRRSFNDMVTTIDRLLNRAMWEQEDRAAIRTLVAIADAIDQNKPLNSRIDNIDRLLSRIMAMNEPGVAQREAAVKIASLSANDREKLSIRQAPRKLIDGARYFGGLMRRLPRERFDIIHAVLPNSYMFGGFLKLRRYPRARLVMSRMGLNWYHDESPLYRVVERRVLHRMLTIGIGNSHAAVRNLEDEGVPSRNLRVIHNGIDVDGWRARMPDRTKARCKFKVANDAIVITCVGNLWPYKGHDDLLKAARHWRELGQPWQLLVAGRDQDDRLTKLQAIAAEFGVAENVQFLGPIDDIPGLLAAADIHVSASHTESLPNNVLEAMCSGLPIVATRAGGTGEMVAPQQNGFLLNIGDASGLGMAVAELAKDQPRREAYGAASLQRVSRDFGIEKNVSKHTDVYRGVMQ
jgi:glycosyltransferase involved in cell wall biosynthesis